MKRLLYIAILLCTLLCGCHGNNGIFEYLLTEFSNLFIKGHSIEMDGLEGCDTVPLPGDKEQIAASFLANIYNRKNEMSIFQKRNEQIFSFFASFFLWLFRPLKYQLKADFKLIKQA